MNILRNNLLLLGLIIAFPTLLFGQGFTDVSAAAKVDSIHGNHPQFDQSFGTGAAWVDYNLDGHLDLYVSNRGKANYLFENNGDGTFVEIAASLNIDDPTGDGAGVSAADFNNDGWPDLYLANGKGDKLFRNNGGTSFTDVSVSSGITASGDRRGASASWGDYDNDGFLDLYVCNWEPISGVATDNQDFLFHNNGDETFTDVSASLGMSNLIAAGFIGGFTDFDLDGDLDIMVINDCPIQGVGIGNLLFQNDGGVDPLNWNFSEVSDAVGIGGCYHGMGLGIGDSNRDGKMEVSNSNIGPAKLHENTGGTFIDISSSAGINIQNFNYLTWGVSFLDYDRDGFQDLLMATGDFMGLNNSMQPNYLFRNNGDNTFTDMAPALGMDDGERSRTMVYGDYDNDGDLDIFIVNYNQEMMLKRNDVENTNHYIKIILGGIESNRDGVGAYIKIKTPDGVYQYFETRCGSNLGGSDERGAYFGLGDNTSIDSMYISWPSGAHQVLTNISADQYLAVIEENNNPLPVDFLFFEAKPLENQIHLSWATASESNNQSFYIERSKDGRNFETIGSINGQGDSEEEAAYTYIDKNPFQGDNYYRLMQEDFDGAVSFSDIKLVTLEENHPLIKIYPNPLNQDVLNIQSSDETQALLLEISNTQGQLIYQEALEGHLEITSGNWPPGIYLVKIRSAANNQVFKLVKH